MSAMRIDFNVEEAGSLIWVAPRSLGGLSPSQLAAIWMGEDPERSVASLVLTGAMIPLSLYQDDGYTVRFVAGDLTEPEQAEWTARATWKLAVPCGEVLVSGILSPDFEREFGEIVPAEDGGSYWAGAYVTLAPGEYRVDVHAYPPGDLSGAWGHIAETRTFGRHPALAAEKALDYLRRTRPGETPPRWMVEGAYDGAGENLFVDFIVQLTPLSESLPEPALEDGVCVEWTFRKPAICPLGIRSTIAAE